MPTKDTVASELVGTIRGASQCTSPKPPTFHELLTYARPRDTVHISETLPGHPCAVLYGTAAIPLHSLAVRRHRRPPRGMAGSALRPGHVIG